MMKPLLDFDDAGAQNDEPVNGVTVGDIRAWHDQYDNMLTTWAECRQLLSEERTAVMAARGQITAIVVTAGGTVEGYPTSEINVLQRIRKLVAIEQSLDNLQALLDAQKYENDYLLVAHIRRALTAEAAASCNHWPGQKRCGVCGMGSSSLTSNGRGTE